MGIGVSGMRPVGFIPERLIRTIIPLVVPFCKNDCLATNILKGAAVFIQWKMSHQLQLNEERHISEDSARKLLDDFSGSISRDIDEKAELMAARDKKYASVD